MGAFMRILPYDRGGADEACASLLQAAHDGREEHIAALADSGISVNCKGGCGESPLHLAAAAGHAGVVHLLLSLGVMRDVRTTSRVRGVPGLRHSQAAPLHAAAGSGSVTVIDGLLQNAAHIVELADAEGMTALHVAAACGQALAIEKLCSHGAHLEARDMKGRTPSMWAAASGQSEALQQCLANGATLSAVDTVGDSALHMASRRGSVACVKGLLEAGSSPYALNRAQESPIEQSAVHPPVYMCFLSHVELLVRRGSQDANAAAAARARLEAQLRELAFDDPLMLNWLLCGKEDSKFHQMCRRVGVDLAAALPRAALQLPTRKVVASLVPRAPLHSLDALRDADM